MSIQADFTLTTADDSLFQCKIVTLTPSDFEAVYQLDMDAFTELAGQYIEKTPAFIEACLASQCSVGIRVDNKLIAVVTVNQEEVKEAERAMTLGFDAHWQGKIGFIEGVFVVPKFRKYGLISKLYSQAIYLLQQNKIKHIFSAIDPRNYANLIAMTKANFAICGLYHSNINGDLRYLVKYYDKSSLLADSSHYLCMTDHVVQKEFFQKNYIGTHIMIKDEAVASEEEISISSYTMKLERLSEFA